MSDTRAALEAAMAAARAGDLAGAVAAAERALAGNPADPNALQIIGMARHREGRIAEALAAFERAARAAPNHPPILNSLGILYRERGDLEKSRACLERAARAAPSFAEARHNLGSTLAALGEDAGAREAFEAAIALSPRSSEALGKYARFLEARHELDAARAMAIRTLAVDPTHALAMMALADLDARAGDHEASIARIDAALTLSLSPVNRAIFLGMRSRALEKLSRFAESFVDCSAANDLVRARYAQAFANVSGPRSPDTLTRLEAFARDAPAALWPKAGDGSRRDPVFFVGFPRSGTTLVDQILSTFGTVSVLEEKECIRDAWLELLIAPDGLERWPSLTAADRERLRAAYWARVSTHVTAPDATLVIDKLPLDTALLGLIHLVFPAAKIIFALRDPRDVVLSCFQQTFAMNAAMYQFLRLETAARYYDQVMRLGMLWREKLPLLLHEVRYERVVADFDREIGALLGFLGLPWSERLRDFQETARKRTIRTPSARQVVQPLYATSAGKWRRYEKELASVRPLLDPWAARFGYDAGAPD